MSADGIHDWEADEASPVRDASRAPGLDARAENTGLGRAFGELASENAELYRRNAEQTKRIDHLEAQLKLKDDRFEAWAREMAWREETMKSRIEQLEHAAGKQDAPDRSTLPGRLEGKAPASGESTRLERRHGKPSNEAIATGAAISTIALTVAGEMIGTPVAANISMFLGEAALAGAVGLAWIRKLREGKNVDRS